MQRSRMGGKELLGSNKETLLPSRERLLGFADAEQLMRGTTLHTLTLPLYSSRTRNRVVLGTPAVPSEQMAKLCKGRHRKVPKHAIAVRTTGGSETRWKRKIEDVPMMADPDTCRSPQMSTPATNSASAAVSSK